MVGQKGIPAVTGGIERHVEELALRLGRMGHEVLVYTRPWFAAPKADFAPGVTAVVTPTVCTKHLDAIAHTLTATVHAIRSGADVIHYHGVGPALLSWIPRIFAPQAKVIATFHCIDRKHAKWGALARLALLAGERAACLFPHATVAVSRTLTAYCRDRFDCEAQYVPNGITPIRGETGTDRLAGLGIAPNGYILMVSRLVRHKGQHRLIEAYRRLKAEGRHGGLKLVLAGGSAFTDGYVRELRALAADDPDIILAGNLTGEDLRQTFANAYLLAHPSSSEGLPIAVLEAMAYGKAVVGSDIPEIAEVIREHGFPVRNGDNDDLAAKLAELIANPGTVRETGRRARAFVEANYDWDDVAREVASLYRKVAGAEQAQLHAGRPVPCERA